jgi:hypothetical protein
LAAVLPDAPVGRLTFIVSKEQRMIFVVAAVLLWGAIDALCGRSNRIPDGWTAPDAFRRRR